MIRIRIYIFIANLLCGYSGLMAFGSNDAYFMENKGQVNDIWGKPSADVLYVADTKGARVYFRSDGISYVFRNISGLASPLGQTPGKHPLRNDTLTASYHRIDLQFGSNTEKKNIVPSEAAPGKLNVYNSNFPNGLEGITFFRKLTYKSIYPGIDAVFYISAGHSLKYEFVVKPGADPAAIRLTAVGAENVAAAGGNLKISCPLGQITEMAPYTYQPFSEKPNGINYSDAKEVPCRFNIRGNEISFDVGKYDISKTLVIDPNVTWSTYYGGSDADHGYAIEVNRIDYVVLTGSTISNDFPVSPGAHQVKLAGSYDLYVTYMDYDGRIIWTTLYGGSLNDYVNDVATDNDLGIYIGGWTWSTDFPLTAGAYQSNWGGYENDAIIVKFDSLGRRKWATFLGGNLTEHLYRIECDNNNDVVVTGWTNSTTFTQAPFAEQPGAYQSAPAGAEDIFLAKFDSAGKYIWGTFMGSDSTDEALGLDIDINNNIYITGYTKSSDFPVTSDALYKFGIGLRDLYFAQFNLDGKLLYSTLYGGSDNDYGYGITVDSNLNIFIAGYTTSTDYPVTPVCFQYLIKGQGDAVVMKLNRNKKMLWATHFGGDGFDYSTDIIADRVNNIVITGRTYGNGLPVSKGAFSDTLSGMSDAFVTKMNTYDGSPIWSTYYGGSNEEIGRSLACDRFSNIYSTGSTLSGDFPLVDPPIQQNYGGLSDAYILKQCVSEPNPAITADGPLEFCSGGSVSLDAGTGFVKYRWSDGSENRFLEVDKSGEYYAVVWDENLCKAYTKPVQVTVFPAPDPSLAEKFKICYGEGITVSVNKDFDKYLWSTGDTTKQIYIDKVGAYDLTVTNSYGCTKTLSFSVSYYPIIFSEFEGPSKVCTSDPVKRYFISRTNADKYEWYITGGEINTGQGTKSVIVNWYSGADMGLVVLRSYSDSSGCTDVDTMKVAIRKSFIPEITTSTGKNYLCLGDTITLSAEEGFSSYQWSTGEATREISVWKEGTYELKILDDEMCIGDNKIEISVFPKPRPAITGDTVICSLGREFTYTTSDNTGSSYQWITKGQITGPPGTANISIVWDKPVLDTVVVIETIDSTGCYGASKGFPIIVSGRPDLKIKHDTPLDFCSGDSVVLYIDRPYAGYKWFDGSEGISVTVKEPGQYFVGAVNEYGCLGYDTVEVTIRPRPAKPSVSQIDDSLYTGQYFKYIWKEGGVEIPGSNAGKYVPTRDGVYTVVVENEFGCMAESDEVIFEKMRAYCIISVKPKNLKGDTILAGSGSNFKAVLHLDSAKYLRKFGASKYTAWLRFNKTVLLPIGSFANLGKDETERFISVSGTLADNSTIEKGILGEVEFSAALGDSHCTVIHLDSVVWDKDIDVHTIDGLFCLSDFCETNGFVRLLIVDENLFFYNVPNPFADETDVVVMLENDTYCSVSMSDILGNKIRTVAQGLLTAGEHKFTVDTYSIPSGIYFLRLVTPTKNIARKIEIIK